MDTQVEAQRILESLIQDSDLGPYVDSLPIPKPHRGTGPIRLIILGQDPTVKNANSRKSIRTVLNLDKRGSLRNYLAGICEQLSVDIDKNVYATNVVKNFFMDPPTEINEIDVLQKSTPLWFPLLRKELDDYDGVPIISLGEPVLGLLVRPPAVQKVRHYWGYVANWQDDNHGPLHRVESSESTLDRPIYPFPHQPSATKRFYAARQGEYVAYVRDTNPSLGQSG